jgi:hypothetical protein
MKIQTVTDQVRDQLKEHIWTVIHRLRDFLCYGTNKAVCR